MNKKIDFFIATGGTGGHVFPAEAIIAHLQSHKYYLGLSYDERCTKIINQKLYSLPQIILFNSKHINNPYSILINILYICFNCYKVLWFFINARPKAIIGFGGYATFIPLLIGIFLRIPIFLHEQNTVLGNVIRFYTPFAKKVFLSFPLTKKQKINSKFITIGLPIRREIRLMHKIACKKQYQLYLAIIGGSQGTTVFNHIVPQAIALLPLTYQKRIKLNMQIHQKFIIQLIFTGQNIKYNLKRSNSEKYIKTIYTKSDLIITRAGGSILAEIISVKQSAIIVPLPTAKKNHQYFNAQKVIGSNLLIMQEQKYFTPLWLKKHIVKFMNNPNDVLYVKQSCHKDPLHKKSTHEISKQIIRIIKI